MSHNDCNCPNCQDLEAAISLLECEYEDLDSLVVKQAGAIKEHEETITLIKDNAEDHSARFSNQLITALRVLIEVNVVNTVKEVESKPLDVRLEAYSEAIDMIFPEGMMVEGFGSINDTEYLMNCEFQLYGTYLDALFETFDMFKFNDAEFIDAYMDHVKTSKGEYYISEYVDALLLVYVLAGEEAELWLNEWPKSSYTDYLKNTFDLHVVRYGSTSDIPPLSQAVCQYLKIHARGLVSFTKIPYQFLFRVLCHNERHVLLTSLLRRAKNVDVLFEMNTSNFPEIAQFWEVFAGNDNSLARLYPKISGVSLIKDTPLYRRINVLKLNGRLG